MGEWYLGIFLESYIRVFHGRAVSEYLIKECYQGMSRGSNIRGHWFHKSLHNMEPIEIDLWLNCPDPENVLISTLNIFTNTLDKNLMFL